MSANFDFNKLGFGDHLIKKACGGTMYFQRQGYNKIKWEWDITWQVFSDVAFMKNNKKY